MPWRSRIDVCRAAEEVVELVDDDAAEVAVEIGDAVAAAGADDLADEALGLVHPDGVGAVGAEPDHAELLVAVDERLGGAPT
jgi:hypothetical protein